MLRRYCYKDCILRNYIYSKTIDEHFKSSEHINLDNFLKDIIIAVMASINTSESLVPNVTFTTDSWVSNTTDYIRNMTFPADNDTTFGYTSNTATMMPTYPSRSPVTQTNGDDDPEYDYYMLIGFSFERPVYLYFWEILVICTSLINMIVVCILLRRKMRNPINVVLASIAVTDTLTGLSTLPAYIITYLNYEPPYEPPMYDVNNLNHHVPYVYSDGTQDMLAPTHMDPNMIYVMNSTYPGMRHDENDEAFGGCKLTKNQCRWFMISRFFISKSFHSMSIYLTLFLAIQRFISVAAPFKAQFITNQRAFLICLIIFLLSPILHIYHLFDEKAKSGNCNWDLEEDGCTKGCVVLWIMFFLRNLIPCCVLLVFTIMFILELRKGEETIRRMDSTKGQIARRVMENRRIAIIVTAIVVVFLIPEIPYGFYLLYNAIDKTVHNGKNMDLETNRAIHMSYELLMVLSFHANFYIYTLFNRKFRICLVKIFVQPVRPLMGDTRRVSITSTIRSSQRRTEQMSMKSQQGINTLNKTVSNTLTEKSNLESTAFMNSVSVDITQTSQHDKDKSEVLNTKV